MTSRVTVCVMGGELIKIGPTPRKNPPPPPLDEDREEEDEEDDDFDFPNAPSTNTRTANINTAAIVMKTIIAVRRIALGISYSS